MVKVGLGCIGDSFSVASFNSYMSEFIAILIFVFAGVGSAIANGNLTSDAALDPPGRVAVALAHAFALFVGVSVAANISGGHLNPAVTLELAVGGNITSSLAFSIVSHANVPTHGVAPGVSEKGRFVMEIVITFMLVYTVYATTADPKKGSIGTIAPIAIGSMVSANILAAGPFSGGSMNPASSFGLAVVCWNYSEIWIYWAGPLVGGSLAGLVYGDIFIGSYAPLPNKECKHPKQGLLSNYTKSKPINIQSPS